MRDSIAAFEASRRRLLSIAYRMLGSMAEAEDVVQDTWLRWHAADPRELAAPVAWLTTVTTRRCAPISVEGSPSTSTMSASLPPAVEPVRLSAPTA